MGWTVYNSEIVLTEKIKMHNTNMFFMSQQTNMTFTSEMAFFLLQ